MRTLIVILFAAAVVGCGQKHGDHAGTGEAHTEGDGHKHTGAGHAGHTEGDGHKHTGAGHAAHNTLMKMDLQTREGIKAGSPSAIRFTILGDNNQPIKSFAVNHDAKVHLIIVRQGLDQFVHLHPEVDPASGTLSVHHTFPTGGVYHLFADYQEVGKSPMTATARVEVAGDAPAAPELKPDVPGLLKGDGIAANVVVEGAKPGAEATVRFHVLDGNKAVTDLESYMGAMGHLVVVSSDAKQYVHAHPTEAHGGAKNAVTFGATFPQAGLYKGWGQFKRGGEIRIVPFVVQVP